jgi:hypothetical protein
MGVGVCGYVGMYVCAWVCIFSVWVLVWVCLGVFAYVPCVCVCGCVCVCVYRVSREECIIIREGVPYVKVYRYNPKHLYQELNVYGNKGQRKVWSASGFHTLYLYMQGTNFVFI